MSFTVLFLFSSYLLVALSIFGLWLTDELAVVYLVAAVGAIGLGFWGDLRQKRSLLPVHVANIGMLGVFGITLFSIFVLKTLPLQELVHFLLALKAVKLLGPKRRRDWLQLYLLSFFSLIAAAALTVDLSFAAIFVAYLFIMPWVLVLFHLRSALEGKGRNPDAETAMAGWPLARLMAGTSAGLLFMTVFFFVTFPRFGAHLLGDALASGSVLTGFSDRVTLGDVAEIQKNGAVAMRVTMDRPAPFRKLYWRGLALDRFDGQRWERSENRLTPLRRVGSTYVVGKSSPDPAKHVRQEFILEPTGSPVLFALDDPVRIIGRLGHVFRDSMKGLRVADPFPFQVSYEVISQLSAERYDTPPTENSLQIPPLDPRILDLSRRLTESLPQRIEKAQAIERYLRSRYRHSLDNLPVGRMDPLGVFLFETREGNCEYFASALAVMLRVLGIPTRVVNGYLGGEWNAYGEYYLVRQSNAHSWVEAFIEGRGWVRLDPTPPLARRSLADLFSSFTQFVDYLGMRWHRYVVSFGFVDQFRVFMALKRSHRWLSMGVRDFSVAKLRPRDWPDPSWWWGLVFLPVAWVVARRWLKSDSRVAHSSFSHEATERYGRFLACIEKRGPVKRPGETADEFARRVQAVARESGWELTDLYQQARFSGRKDDALLTRMDELLAVLLKRCRPGEPMGSA